MRMYGWHEPMMFGAGITRMVKILVIINVGVFILQMLSQGVINVYLGLSPERVFRHFFIWQLFTYMFLHGAVFHILINMLILWMFGRELESLWGEKTFLRYYLTCGVGAGIVTYLFTMNSSVITIGASGAIFGIMVAFAVIFPERYITLLIFFILPITLKAKHLVMGLAGIELLYCISGTQDGVGHFAHIGGAAVGYIYLRIWRRSSVYDVSYWEKFTSKIRDFLNEKKTKNDRDLDREIDRILDKISRNGMKSLSRREKNTLQKKSKK